MSSQVEWQNRSGRFHGPGFHTEILRIYNTSLMKLAVALTVGLAFCLLLWWSRSGFSGDPASEVAAGSNEARLVLSYSEFKPEEKVTRTEAEWRRLLNAGQFRITRK